MTPWSSKSTLGLELLQGITQCKNLGQKQPKSKRRFTTGLFAGRETVVMQLRSLSSLWGAGWQVKQRNMYVYIYIYVYIKLIYYISIYYNNLVLFVFICSAIYSMVIYTFSSVSCFITLLANFSVMISLDYSSPCFPCSCSLLPDPFPVSLLAVPQATMCTLLAVCHHPLYYPPKAGWQVALLHLPHIISLRLAPQRTMQLPRGHLTDEELLIYLKFV